MRLMLAAALAVTNPAAAQRVDTTRIDITRTSDGGQTCRFRARPELRMTHGPNGAHARAEWTKPARSKDATLIVRLMPGTGRHGLWTVVDPILLDSAGVSGHPTAARLMLDGTESKAMVRLAPSHAIGPPLRVLADEEDREALAAEMMFTKVAELVLYDRAGKEIRRYAWDVDWLDSTVEIPAIAGWNCKGR
jgi:hypothetical protein